MSDWVWVVIILVLMVPVSFVGMYFEHRAKWESGRPIRPLASECPCCRHVLYAVHCDCSPELCEKWKGLR